MINLIKESSMKIEIETLSGVRDSISKWWNEFVFKGHTIINFEL